MGPSCSKALGPNGMSGFFIYQKYWYIVGEYVTNVVLRCLKKVINHSYCPNSQNQTHYSVVWSMAPSRIQKQGKRHQHLGEVLRKLMHDLPSEDFELATMWMWYIWFNRNMMINEEKFLDPKTIVVKARDHLEEFRQVQAIPIITDSRSSLAESIVDK